MRRRSKACRIYRVVVASCPRPERKYFRSALEGRMPSPSLCCDPDPAASRSNVAAIASLRAIERRDGHPRRPSRSEARGLFRRALRAGAIA
jgi:hypothetical protein